MARAGVNDPKLAKSAGTSKQQIHKLRRGERKLTVQWAQRLAPHLNVTWQELIEGAVSPMEADRSDWLALYDEMTEEERRPIREMIELVVRRKREPEPASPPQQTKRRALA